MSKAELIKYWFNSSEQDWDTVLVLLASKKNMYALFFCHLSLEKYLKGIIVRDNNTAPITHDLLILSEKAKVELTTKQAKLLYDVNAFNIKARYDDYKNSFYKRATASFTKKYITEVNNFILWLKKQ